MNVRLLPGIVIVEKVLAPDALDATLSSANNCYAALDALQERYLDVERGLYLSVVCTQLRCCLFQI